LKTIFSRFQPTLARQKPTLIGASTILIWSSLALLTKLSGDIPPLQLTAQCFTLAFAIGLLFQWRSGQPLQDMLKQPLPVWLVGVGGLFINHVFYFIAIQNAPVIEASLISYLWPLLIVLFSSLLPGERLRWYHLAGALIGFAGAGLLITKGQSLNLEPRYLTGYLAALICAIAWASYSVLSRRFGTIPTSAVGSFCGATALLAWVCHFLFEPTTLPTSALQTGAIAALGLGPVGVAFFTWDYGVKNGNIKVLGTLSYATPLLSTLLLMVCGFTEPSGVVLLACALIIGGALLAMLDFFRGENH
jgi:drug/metabolite transporter (DMT)-like permease